MDPLTRRTALPGLVLLGVLCTPADVAGQLISPGKLAEAHADLEGVRNCTRCHALGERGASADRCLACHAPLRARIERGRGLHGTYEPADCGTCHKEHAGPSGRLVRFDPTDMNHAIVGYPLRGAHENADCRTCHTAERIQDREVRRLKGAAGALDRTFLGLGTSCVACHEAEDPHDDQFPGRGCEDCHTEVGWENVAGFDHAATRYPLNGRHASVDCVGCHVPPSHSPPGTSVRYRPVDFASCASCHADPHGREFGADCASCHVTAGWDRIPRGEFERRFDHSSTAFPLIGAHGAADCAACHGTVARTGFAIRHESGAARYPRPRTDRDCLSCHVDSHRGELAESASGANCRACHGQRAWLPASFDLHRHAETPFPLEGAHRAVPCVSCHTGGADPDAGVTFDVASDSCSGCHVEDPHRSQFEGRDCAACHSVEGFTRVAVDHDATRFPLEGAHAVAACGACHMEEVPPDGAPPFVRYRPLSRECSSCHGEGVGS